MDTPNVAVNGKWRHIKNTSSDQLMHVRSCRRFTLTRIHRCKNQGDWVSGCEGKRTAKLSLNFSTPALPALNLGALGRTLDVQSYGDAFVVSRRRRDRVRTNFLRTTPFCEVYEFIGFLQNGRIRDRGGAFPDDGGTTHPLGGLPVGWVLKLGTPPPPLAEKL